jgi:transcriptional regulator with XRE-family HTH domain
MVAAMTSNELGYVSGIDLVIGSPDLMRIARMRRHIEQEDMATQLGVSSSTISNWENGRTSPKVSNLLAWAQITGFNMSSLLHPVGGDGADREQGPRATKSNVASLNDSPERSDALRADIADPDDTVPDDEDDDYDYVSLAER